MLCVRGRGRPPWGVLLVQGRRQPGWLLFVPSLLLLQLLQDPPRLRHCELGQDAEGSRVQLPCVLWQGACLLRRRCVTASLRASVHSHLSQQVSDKKKQQITLLFGGVDGVIEDVGCCAWADSVNGYVRKSPGTPLSLRGAATGRGRGQGRGRGRGRGTLQFGRSPLSPSEEEPSSSAESESEVEPEAAVSDAPVMLAVKPAPAPRVAKPAAGRKQRVAPSARDGLRHAKQNYEKLAGVKRSRTKAAAARRLVASARRAPAAKRLVPRRADQAASKGRKPPLQRKSLPGPPPKKARLEEPAQPVEAAKVWKAPDAITLSAVRGRGSSRGGHLRQGSSRQTTSGLLALHLITRPCSDQHQPSRNWRACMPFLPLPFCR